MKAVACTACVHRNELHGRIAVQPEPADQGRQWIKIWYFYFLWSAEQSSETLLTMHMHALTIQVRESTVDGSMSHENIGRYVDLTTNTTAPTLTTSIIARTDFTKRSASIVGHTSDTQSITIKSFSFRFQAVVRPRRKTRLRRRYSCPNRELRRERRALTTQGCCGIVSQNAWAVMYLSKVTRLGLGYGYKRRSINWWLLKSAAHGVALETPYVLGIDEVVRCRYFSAHSSSSTC